jgi:ribokinase
MYPTVQNNSDGLAISCCLEAGRAGACLATSGGEEHCIAPILVDAVDSTAAGDTFNGALAAALCQVRRCSRERAICRGGSGVFGNAEGAQAFMPSASEVIALLAERGH